MTNEEKSSQIANDMTLPWITLGTPYDSIKQACEEMAKWKDSQIPDCGVIINSEMYKSVAVDCDTCEHCDLESYCKQMNELKYNTEQPCKLFGNGRVFKKVKC